MSIPCVRGIAAMLPIVDATYILDLHRQILVVRLLTNRELRAEYEGKEIKRSCFKDWQVFHFQSESHEVFASLRTNESKDLLIDSLWFCSQALSFQGVTGEYRDGNG